MNTITHSQFRLLALIRAAPAVGALLIAQLRAAFPHGAIIDLNVVHNMCNRSPQERENLKVYDLMLEVATPAITTFLESGHNPAFVVGPISTAALRKMQASVSGARALSFSLHLRESEVAKIVVDAFKRTKHVKLTAEDFLIHLRSKRLLARQHSASDGEINEAIATTRFETDYQYDISNIELGTIVMRIAAALSFSKQTL